VYLWEQLFFRPGSRIGVPLAVLGALTAAALSYFVVEQPSLRLRARLERRWALRRHAVPLAPAGGPRSHSVESHK